jgi:hypothetical protein
MSAAKNLHCLLDAFRSQEPSVEDASDVRRIGVFVFRSEKRVEMWYSDG